MASLKGKAYLKDTEAWQKLQNYFDQNKNAINILELFTKDPERFSKYSLKVDTPLDGPLLVDYSKNRINDEVMELLLNLGKCIKTPIIVMINSLILNILAARERGVEEARDAMFKGERINFTEDRAVLHVALRNRSNVPMLVWRQFSSSARTKL